MLEKASLGRWDGFAGLHTSVTKLVRRERKVTDSISKAKGKSLETEGAFFKICEEGLDVRKV